TTPSRLLVLFSSLIRIFFPFGGHVSSQPLSSEEPGGTVTSSPPAAILSAVPPMSSGLGSVSSSRSLGLTLVLGLPLPLGGPLSLRSPFSSLEVTLRTR